MLQRERGGRHCRGSTCIVEQRVRAHKAFAGCILGLGGGAFLHQLAYYIELIAVIITDVTHVQFLKGFLWSTTHAALKHVLLAWAQKLQGLFFQVKLDIMFLGPCMHVCKPQMLS